MDKKGLKESISLRASQKGKRKEVSARAKLKAIVRKVIESSTWLSPIMAEIRDPTKETKKEWLTLEEKLALLGREEDRSDEIIDQLTRKFQYLPGFIDYNYGCVRELIQACRFVAFGPERTLFKSNTDPRAAYMILGGEVLLRDDKPLSLPIQILGHVPKEINKPPPIVKRNTSRYSRPDIIGEQEIIAGEKRKSTAYIEGSIQLICFEKQHLLKILMPNVIKDWENKYNDLRKYRLFKFYDSDMLKEVVKFAKYVSFRSRHHIKMKFMEDGFPETSYFLLLGTCQVIQRLLVVRNENNKGFYKFKLYYWQDQMVYPEWVEPVYMRSCYLQAGAFFGIGERLGRHKILAETPCRFLTLPGILIQHLKSKLPTYNEVLKLADEVYPSTIDLFLTFVYGRLWHEYSRETVKRCSRGVNNNTIHDAPVNVRAVQMKMKPKALEAIYNHQDYLVGLDIHDLIKKLNRMKKQHNLLNEQQEFAFSHYKAPYSKKIMELHRI